jgi:hypothetical protein
MATNEEDINRLASQILGPAPVDNATAGAMDPAEGLPPGPATAPVDAPPMDAAPPQPSASDADAKETVSEEVSKSASPQTEDDKSKMAGVVYEIEFGKDDKRKLNDTQIKSTFERYGKLNEKHAKVKPAMELVENLMKNKGMDAAGIKDYLENASKAFEKNPVMGNTDNPKNVKADNKMAIASDDMKTPDEVEKMFSKYEEENSIELPPGYREQFSETAKLRDTIEKQNAMITQLVDASRGMADNAAKQVEGVEAQGADNMKQQIGMNLNQAQQANGLSDEDANDFMVFAAERGYTMEDFIDPNLTQQVVADFANAKSTPEMARLKDISNRRNAISGSIGSSPSVESGAAVPNTDPNAEILGRLSQRRMNV